MAQIESAWGRVPGYSIDLVPCRGTARVRVGSVVVAESDAAVRVIETDHVERLYFPTGDVRLDLLAANDHETTCPFKGKAGYWSHPDVEDVFWAYRRPFPEVAGIADLMGVWHEKDGVEVEVETRWADGAVSVNRFPAWGDQEDLVRVLDAQPVEPGRYEAPGYHHRARNVVEGGQLVGQAIVAAARQVPHQRVTWAAATFARAASFGAPIDVGVEVLRPGRTFSTLSVRLEQGGKLISPVTVLTDAGAPDTMRLSQEMPEVPAPEDCEPYDMAVTGRALRIAGGAYSPDPDRIGPPEMHAWVRFRDDPAELFLRQALVAQASTHWTIAAAMLPHPGFGESLAHVTLSTGPMAMSISFHDDQPLDEWFLYTTSAIWSGQGLAQGHGLVFSRSGTLMASYSLQAMIRAMLPAGEGKGYSTAM